MLAVSDQTSKAHISGLQPRKRTLLIVDDDEGPRKSLEMIFKDDYQVLLAASGAEALEVIKHQPIDTAVLDIRMYGMSGIDLLEKLKAADPTIEAIMLTGFETIETIRQAFRYGACDYLSKPFEIEAIRNAVAIAMEKRTLADEIRSTQRQMAALQVELRQQSVREKITSNKGEIYASVLHDINGPLTIIAGYVQLINQSMEGVRSIKESEVETLKNHLRLINRQVTHCVEISHRYLSFLRNKPKEKSTVQVNKVLEDLNALLKGHPSRKNHLLQIEMASGDPILAINGADLIQILLNLAINAFQSTDKQNTVKICGVIVRDPLPIDKLKDGLTDHTVFPENFENRPPYVKLSVQDKGPGIPSETFSKIFEPFFTTKGDKGTGLGLSIVQRMLKEAGGVLHVHSELGEGTVFNLYFPTPKSR